MSYEIECGHYTCLPVTVTTKGGESREEYLARKKKYPNTRRQSFVSIFHYIFMRDNRSGLTWVFVGVRRDEKLRFSDGRDVVTNMGQASRYRMPIEELRAILHKLTGAEDILVNKMFNNEIDGEEAQMILPPWREAIRQQKKKLAEHNEKSERVRRIPRNEVGKKVPIREKMRKEQGDV